MQVIKTEKNKITFLLKLDTNLKDEDLIKIKDSLTSYSGGLYDLLRFRFGLIHDCWYSVKDDIFEVTFTTLDAYAEDVEKEFRSFLKIEQ